MAGRHVVTAGIRPECGLGRLQVAVLRLLMAQQHIVSRAPMDRDASHVLASPRRDVDMRV